MAECCIVLAGSCLPSFLTQPRTTCLGNGTTKVNWALQQALLIQPFPTDMPMGQSDEDNYSTDTPIPGILNCVSLTVVGNQDSTAP